MWPEKAVSALCMGLMPEIETEKLKKLYGCIIFTNEQYGHTSRQVKSLKFF
jgi:hypothetical protein